VLDRVAACWHSCRHGRALRPRALGDSMAGESGPELASGRNPKTKDLSTRDEAERMSRYPQVRQSRAGRTTCPNQARMFKDHRRHSRHRSTPPPRNRASTFDTSSVARRWPPLLRLGRGPKHHRLSSTLGAVSPEELGSRNPRHSRPATPSERAWHVGLHELRASPWPDRTERHLFHPHFLNPQGC